VLALTASSALRVAGARVITPIAEPWRTRIILGAFSVAPLWLASNTIHFDLLAIPIIGGAVAWSMKAHPDRNSLSS
jgi:hypothetical protein